MARRLTDEQHEILSHVRAGHNFLISGQAGTGKSFLVTELVKTLRNQGKSVVVICSSGIATTVYKLDIKCYTVHSFYGLKTADLHWNLVVDRAVANNVVRERVADVDCIIWDEASMSSRRIFEIVNRIHLAVAPTRSYRPFDGKQIVIVGEFLQLRPVPNFLDGGQFMFKSPVFDRAITHRQELTTIMRQDKNEEDFTSCLKDVRLGRCTKPAFIKGLARPLSEEVVRNATNIFFRKISAQLFNHNTLNSLPGEIIHFKAEDDGDTREIQCPADCELFLKPNCKVMLLWNKNDKLRNGTSGVFLQPIDDSILVLFEGVGQVKMKRETWHKRGVNGDIVGCRTQFPVTLMYGVTCHKSQGLTLPAAIVHCSKEFVPGLIYVSFTRVRKSDHLQVLNFRPSQLLAPDPECVNICAQNREMDVNLECCRKSCLLENELTVTESLYELPVDDDEFIHPSDVSEIKKNMVLSYFERGNPDEVMLDLETIYAVLVDESNEDFCKTPPPTFDVRFFLEQMKVRVPLTTYAESKNQDLDTLNLNEDTDVFGKLLWSRVCQIILEDAILDNDLKISSSQWSVDTREMYLLITTSSKYLRDIQLLFGTDQPSRIQTAICAELMMEVYKKVISAVADKVRTVEMSSPIEFNVWDMPKEGLGKVRHVGAYVVRKVLNKNLKYIRKNMVSCVPSTQNSVSECHSICNLLEDHIIGNVSTLLKDSKYPDTLSVTEDRQYRSRGLTHIEDCAFEFFMEVEAVRVICMNDCKLREQRENLVDYTLHEISHSQVLKEKWNNSFFSQDQDYVNESENTKHKHIIEKIFEMMVKKYVMVGSGQYMRDFRLGHRLKKSAEHRKQVLVRKTALEEKKAAIPFNYLQSDPSAGKATSHHLLKAYVEKFGEAAFVKVYSKVEILKICKAYGVQSNTKFTKTKLARNIFLVLRQTPNQMPYPFYLDNLEVYANADDANQRVILRIRRT